MSDYVTRLVDEVKAKNPAEPEFHQAVAEVFGTLEPVLRRNPRYGDQKILERMVEPERVVSFRIPWIDDAEEVQVNRGWRVQMNSTIGPYKGGLRFHPTVTQGTLKFLAFEQVFKNALTGLPLGGGKGGADFDPKGRSDAEIMRFCQSFMTELARFIGSRTDVPAGDIGVGAREIGFLFGQYKRMANQFTGVFTGKGLAWGGSLLRTEATGYGCVYFAQEMLATRDDTLEGKVCLVSGAGNVAQHTAEKLIELGAKVVTLSDSDGHVYDEAGIDADKLAWVKALKNERRGRMSEYVEEYPDAVYTARDDDADHDALWAHPADCAFPSATQNELNATDAGHLIDHGVRLVAEGANMPCTTDAIHRFLDAEVLFAPGKAANAGGVAVSGLEMAQNSMGYPWTRERVDDRLREIMSDIHGTCLARAEEYGMAGNYVAGANIGGFIKVADAMLDQGVV